jgi:hypothetical protein
VKKIALLHNPSQQTTFKNPKALFLSLRMLFDMFDRVLKLMISQEAMLST